MPVRPSSWAAAERSLWPQPASRGPPAAVAAAAAIGLDLPDVAQATFPVPTDQPQETHGSYLEKLPFESDSSWLGLPIQAVGSTHWAAWLQT